MKEKVVVQPKKIKLNSIEGILSVSYGNKIYGNFFFIHEMRWKKKHHTKQDIECTTKWKRTIYEIFPLHFRFCLYLSLVQVVANFYSMKKYFSLRIYLHFFGSWNELSLYEISMGFWRSTNTSHWAMKPFARQ